MALTDRLWRGWRITPLLTLIMSGTLALAIGLVTAFDVARHRQLLAAKLEEAGRLVAQTWSDVFADSLYLGDVERLTRVSRSLQAQPSIVGVDIFDTAGRVVATGRAPEAAVPEIPEELRTSALRSSESVMRDAGGRLVVARAITAGSEVIGGVRVELDRSAIDAEVRDVVTERFKLALVVLAVGVVISHSVARSLTAPVRRLIEATRQVASGDLIFSADPQRRDELGDLMVAFDQMADQLRDAAEAQSREANQRLELINARLRDEVEKRRQAQLATEQTNLALSEQVAWRTRLEAERERVIAELEARNSEMERFTYTVSHDLKSPLVTIRGFIGLLRSEVAAGDRDGAARSLERVDAAARRMQQLLDELLELSRVGRVMNEPVDLDMGELAQEAQELVSGEAQAAGARIEIDPHLPPAFGDRHRILEVYENLLANAVKFGAESPRIGVGWRDDAGTVVYTVHDDGVGIDARYQEKVFGLFERLDSNTPGTGIGLALVKRIVELHRGRVWVESEGLGRGSTFCFTLGLAQQRSVAAAREV